MATWADETQEAHLSALIILVFLESYEGRDGASLARVQERVHPFEKAVAADCGVVKALPGGPVVPVVGEQPVFPIDRIGLFGFAPSRH